MTELNIQAVTGLIKRSPAINKSHRYKTLSKKAGRTSRSVGLFAEKQWNGQIAVSYSLINYYDLAEARAKADFAAFVEFAEAEGYTITITGKWSGIITK